MRIKICGITNTEDALAAADYGADALGFVFFDRSPRSIEPERAAEIISYLPPFVTPVGVFVNEAPERITAIVRQTGISVVQLHGDEPPDVCRHWSRVVKALRLKDFTDLRPLERYRVSALLLDTYSPVSYGGTGQIFNWDIAKEARRFGRVILAGGLNPDNVGRAIQWVRPYGVDVSSGIESEKGKKDLRKLRQFIEKARAALP
jgi:phosphoribosylanthranilate isomerase